MKALILQEKGVLSIGDIPEPTKLGPKDVKIRIRNVGICGSDVHYFKHGSIGPYVVEKPMVLGHEASGEIVEIGELVEDFCVGDRVCMEPGIPNSDSTTSKQGLYNLDPDVRFWATPPVDGCLTEQVVHPAAYTFHLPDTVSFAEGAMVEPLATGLQAMKKATVAAGDAALVIGAGTIGILTALSALAAGCSQVIISDVDQSKLDIAAQYDGLIPVNVSQESLIETVLQKTQSQGVNSVFEASGNARAFENITDYLCPNGCLVLIGMPLDKIPFDVVAIQSKEIRIEAVFRYANIFDRAVSLIASGKIDVKPLISKVYEFDDSIIAYERAVAGEPGDVKVQIELK